MSALKAILLVVFVIVSSNFSSNRKFSIIKSGKAETAESKTEAMDALQMVSRWNAFPNIDIPPDAYTKAWQYYQANFPKAYNKSGVASWTSMGPINTGGRTISIAIDPVDTSVIWLGSASGGLWKSKTSGNGTAAWQYIPTGYPVMGVGGIAIDPTNTKVMYIGTGETYNYGSYTIGLIDRTTRGSYGIGILKTTDGGATWRPSLNWLYQQNRGVWKIIINPKKTTTVYAATTEGVYKSLDSGNTWVNVLPQKMVMDIALDPIDTNVIYAGVGNLNSANKGLYQTTNSGNSWNVLTNGLPADTQQGRITISIYPKNPKIVMVEICAVYATDGIYLSTDQGKSWKRTANNQNIASYQGWYAKGLLMKPDDSSTVMAGGIYLYRSVDMADNFAQDQTVHADFHDIVPNPKDPNKIYIIGDGGIFRSDDFGQNYYDCNNGYVTTQYYIGSVSKTDSTVMLGGIQDNYTQEFADSSYWYPVIGGDGSYNAIDQDDDDNQYGSFQYLNVYSSYDRGVAFYNPSISMPQNPVGVNPAAFLAPFVLCPSNQNTVYAGADYMIKSTDGLGTYNQVGPNEIDSGNQILTIATSYTSTDSLYCATGAYETNHIHVFRSIDGGSNYVDITQGLPNRYPRRIVVDPHNSKIIYIVFAGFGTGHIFRSKDAGAHWTDLSTSLPDLPFHCLCLDPQFPNMIYAGCDFTVFVSSDTGKTWTSLATGFPDAVMVFDLVISPSNRNLLAFTFGHGVYTMQLPGVKYHNSAIEYTKASNSNFDLYPNPALDYIYLDFHRPVGIKDPIEIFDVNGKLVQSEQAPESSNMIKTDISGLNQGVYFIKFTLNGEAIVRKFLKTD